MDNSIKTEPDCKILNTLFKSLLKIARYFKSVVIVPIFCTGLDHLEFFWLGEQSCNVSLGSSCYWGILSFFLALSFLIYLLNIFLVYDNTGWFTRTFHKTRLNITPNPHNNIVYLISASTYHWLYIYIFSLPQSNAWVEEAL